MTGHSIGIILALLILITGNAGGEELLADQEMILPTKSDLVPQAPRISPGGDKIVYECYSNKSSSLWIASVNGENDHCLTCAGALAKMKLENGYWHPSGKYIVFNEVPQENQKKKSIMIAQVEDGKIVKTAVVAEGSRPQFSMPLGHAVFFEATQVTDKRQRGYKRFANLLSYRIVGENPLWPTGTSSVDLRGPIQKVNQTAEVTHPSLAPDGTTIMYAARTTTIRSDYKIHLNDIDRQKIYKLWQELIKTDRRKIKKELTRFAVYNEQIPCWDGPCDEVPSKGLPAADAFGIIMEDEAFLSRATVVPGFTRKHFYFAYLLGLCDMLDIKNDFHVQQLIFARIWTTNVFGAPIVPLVKDVTSTPLPQKWPTVSHDGKFVVFEAGHYSDRHIYLIAKKGDQWMDKAIKITELGTYNSSPELDPTGQWLFFESNRDGTKAIWRAKLNWTEINKRLGL